MSSRQKNNRKKVLTQLSQLADVIDTVIAIEKRVTDVEAVQETTAGTLMALNRRMEAAEARLETNEGVGAETARLLGTLTKEANELVGTVETLSQDVKRNSENMAATNLRVYKHDEKISKYDEDDKQKTLLIEGYPETRGEDLRGVVDELFRDLQLSYGNEKVEAVYRMGKAPVNRPEFKRPVVLKLANKSMKGDIYRNVRKLRDMGQWNGVSLMDQLDEKERRQYNDLRCLFFLARRNKIAGIKLRQRSVLIGGKPYYHKDLNDLPYGLNMKMATSVKTPDGIGFKSEHNPLSNLFSCKVDDDDHTYNSVEQALQFNKAKACGNREAGEQIMASNDPYFIMKVGSSLNPPAEWKKDETKKVYSYLRSKFNDHTVRGYLLKTKKNHLYELTYHKTYGTGHHLGNAHKLTQNTVVGGNVLGTHLEKLRKEIRDQHNTSVDEEGMWIDPEPIPQEEPVDPHEAANDLVAAQLLGQQRQQQQQQQQQQQPVDDAEVQADAEENLENEEGQDTNND